jgi:hypothetical protein
VTHAGLHCVTCCCSSMYVPWHLLATSTNASLMLLHVFVSCVCPGCR